MSTTYKIIEVSKRSGFTPARLRYYEEVGLVVAAARRQQTFAPSTTATMTAKRMRTDA